MSTAAQLLQAAEVDAQTNALHVAPSNGMPHDPLALVLYARAGQDPLTGFAVGSLDNIELSPCAGALMLAPSPGTERRLTESSGSFGGLTTPTNVAIANNGDVYLVDRGNAVLKYFDRCDCAFKPVPCFSSGSETHTFAPLNVLNDPTGLAITGTTLMIADRGHHRVVLMNLIGAVPRGALRLPVATGLRKLWSPFAIALDAERRIYVSDPDHGRIDIFAPDGRWLKAWLGLGAVTHLAVDCTGKLLAVIEDFSLDSAGNLIAAAVEIVDGVPKAIDARAVVNVRRFPCRRIAVDGAGRLHLGASCSPPTAAVFDLQGYPIKDKDKTAPLIYSTSGTFRTAALDSRRRSCVWHRVVLSGALPQQGRIDVQTVSSDVELDDNELADLPTQAWSDVVSIRTMQYGLADVLVRSPPGRYLWLRLTFASDGKCTPCVDRIIIEFPRVSLRRYLPSVYGMDPLATDFTDRFTSLFDTTLRSIENRIDRMYELFDPSTAPATRVRTKTRDGQPVIDFLSWLASWIGVILDRQWPERLRRDFLKSAANTFTQRGTRTGLYALLLTFLGFDRKECTGSCEQHSCTPPKLNCRPPPPECGYRKPPLILEHFRLRRWLFVGAGKLGDDAALWGKRIVNRSQLSGAERTGNARVGPLNCPPDRQPATQLIATPDPLRDPFYVYAHKFSVFVPACVKQRDWQRRGLERLLAMEAPAHTQWQIEYVEPRFRIGVQAMIGLDSVIARVPKGMRLNQNVLGQGTVLPPHPGRPSVVGVNARVGETTRLN